MIKVNYINLCVTSFNLAKKDIIIFTPFLFFFLIFNLLDFKFNFTNAISQTSLFTIGVLSIIWFCSLFFEAITLLMIKSLLHNEHVHLKESLLSMPKKFFVLFINIFILFLPILFIIKYLTSFNSFQNISPLKLGFIIICVIFMCILSLISQFLPVIVILENHSFFKPLLKSIKFAFKNFINIIIYLALILSITFFMVLFSLLFESMPVIGDIIFKSFFQGILNTFLLVIALNFYLMIKKNESAAK
jgi:hypothetical protein